MIRSSIVFLVAIACGCMWTSLLCRPVPHQATETSIDPMAEKCRLVSLATQRLLFKNPQQAVIVLEVGRRPVLYVKYKSGDTAPDVEAIVFDGIPVIEGPLTEEQYSRLLQ